jgi:hypothetical protein
MDSFLTLLLTITGLRLVFDSLAIAVVAVSVLSAIAVSGSSWPWFRSWRR